jgi:predicted PhzF superfamily epimerase YddE/YHI9
MAELHVVRVFCAPDGSGGNPLGVFLDGGSIEPADRQAVAAELGFAETVFVDDAERGEIRIFTPGAEVPFAGHPVVGTGWLLAGVRGGGAPLHPPAGEVPVRVEGESAFAAGRAEWAPEWQFVELASPVEVDAVDGPPEGHDAVGVWAWIDEGAGLIRERVFAEPFGIAEDEATGSAAVVLASRLDRELEIRQGKGSLILARPLAGGMVEIGGRVELEQVREDVV